MSVFALIRKWFWPVVIITVLAAIISVVVAITIPNKYRSVSVFYPTALQTTDAETILEGKQKVEISNSPEDADRIISIGQSQILANHILKKFDLYKRYKIDTLNNAFAFQDAVDEFNVHYTINLNERDAIEVSFLDTDYTLAANIANEIVQKIDQLNQELTYENRLKVVHIHEERYNMLLNQFVKLRDSLSTTRAKYSLFNHDRQGRELARQLTSAESELLSLEAQLQFYKAQPANSSNITQLKAQIAGKKASIAGLKSASTGTTMNLENLIKAEDWVNELFEQYSDVVSRFNNARAAYENAKLGLNLKVSTLYVVQKAIPSARKAKPARFLIVLATTFGSFFMSLIAIAAYEFYVSERQKHFTA